MKDFLSGLRGRLITILLVLALPSPLGVAQSNVAAPIIHAVEIGNGITLHYVDLGKGAPVIFVHGSLSDGGDWAGQGREFPQAYRAVSYTPPGKFPAHNPPPARYTAFVFPAGLPAFL